MERVAQTSLSFDDLAFAVKRDLMKMLVYKNEATPGAPFVKAGRHARVLKAALRSDLPYLRMPRETPCAGKASG